MRILAVDPGEKRIGLAISDELEISVNPMGVIQHESRKQSAEAIHIAAQERSAGMILIGCALDEHGQPSASGRKAVRLAEEIKLLTDLPVELTDEYQTTNEAVALGLTLGLPKHKRRGHQDATAAVILLQHFLETRRQEP